MLVKIYAVRNRSSNDTYVGSTKRHHLSQRWSHHTYGFRNYEAGKAKWVSSFLVMKCPTAYIELLEECDEEVRKTRERWWIENTPNCVNIHYKPPTEEDIVERRRKDTEKMRRWRASHPDVGAQRARERRKDPEYREEENRRQRERRAKQKESTTEV